MGFQWVDSFVTYGGAGNPVTPGVWRGVLPSLENGGRDGTPRARWNNHSMVHSGGGAGFVVSMAIKMEYSPVLIRTLSDRRNNIANTLTSKNWIVGCAWNGFAYFGVVATMDGALHLVGGGAFENGPNSQDVTLLASSYGGMLPFRGWSLLTVKAQIGDPGTVFVYVNGRQVINYGGYNKPPGDFCQYVRRSVLPCSGDDISEELWPNYVTDICIGGPTRGSQYAGNVGWTGYIDSVWGFDLGGTYGGYLGDLKVETLSPNGAGAFSESIIAGTTPAPTRWQSVDDALTPDGEATGINFDDSVFPQKDEYTVGNMPQPDPEIFGVHALAIARRGAFGSAAMRLSLGDGVDTIHGGLLRVRAPQLRSIGYGFPLSPAGADWTLADVNALRLRLTREA